MWSGWTGSNCRIITFNNDFIARAKTLSYKFCCEATASFPVDLYDLRKNGLEAWRGSATFEEQLEVMRIARAAFVTGSRPAPYTLGLIEAWTMGVPVVHLGREISARGVSGVFEIDKLIENGRTGFLVDTVDEARDALGRLVAEPELAALISQAARSRAIEVFGIDGARLGWHAFFRDVLGHGAG